MLSLLRLSAGGLYGSEFWVLDAQVVLYTEAFDAQREVVFSAVVAVGSREGGVLRGVGRTRGAEASARRRSGPFISLQKAKRESSVGSNKTLNAAKSARARGFSTYGCAEGRRLRCRSLTLPGDVERVRILQAQSRKGKKNPWSALPTSTATRQIDFSTRQGRWRTNAAVLTSNNRPPSVLWSLCAPVANRSARNDLEENAKMRQIAAPDDPPRASSGSSIKTGLPAIRLQ